MPAAAEVPTDPTPMPELPTPGPRGPEIVPDPSPGVAEPEPVGPYTPEPQGPSVPAPDDPPAPDPDPEPEPEPDTATDGRAGEPRPRSADMNPEAIGIYLNDHLAGSTLGVDHARQLEARYEGTEFGPAMSQLADEIDADRDTLIELMNSLDVTRNPVKAATAWVAEKAGRVKFSGATAGDAELGNFLALETLSLGVEGKRSLWTTLKTVASDQSAFEAINLDRLISRADSQRAALEGERHAAAVRAFGSGVLAP